MDILYLLIPLSVVLVFLILAALGWAIYRGQFDDVEREGQRILDQD
jgi:cbb3-type cytochrome oxidase maturation protein